jgi:peptidoglycan/xylan/chitin deacetylase (PgdA/CDA1 family)
MLARNEKNRTPILMYHSISRHATPKFKPFTVSPELFAEHMACLHQHAYTPITVTQFVEARAQGASVSSALPERPVVLTFDDGFADFFTEALPVLKQYGFTATLYVLTEFINGTSRWLQHEGEATRPMLTWDQLTEISKCSIEIGAHSLSHRQLNTLLPAMAREEIVHCKRLLEHHLGREVSTFAYPFGYHSATLRQLVREAGYTSACTVKDEICSETTNSFALVRLTVSADTTVDTFAALLSGVSSAVATEMYRRTQIPVWQLAQRRCISVMWYLQGELLAQ